MDRSNPYFVLSGLVSLFLFTFFVVIFIGMMLSNTEISTFALNKNNYVSISLESVILPTKKVNKAPVIKKEISQPITEVKEVDINSLFSEVLINDIKIEKKIEKKVDNQRLKLIQKKIKKSQENLTQSVEEVVENDKVKEIDDEDNQSSSGDEVNEYLARIKAIVYKYFEPPANSQGHTVTVVIELSSYGKVFDFRILKNSENQALNKECDRIKDRLLGILFPINPNNSSYNAIVKITSDK